MDCIVLTYDVPHRKTYDILTLLKATGYCDVLVYAVPMMYKKQYVPLLAHRPASVHPIPPRELSCNLGFAFRAAEGYEELADMAPHKILIAGATILPENIIKQHTIINAHPGYVPIVRGLDALKWAIYEGNPIGVTSHIISEHVDAGWIIERRKVPVYQNDTFHAVAQRQYEMEISMLAASLELEPSEYTDGGTYPVHKRMPHAMEAEVLERFAIIRKNTELSGGG